MTIDDVLPDTRDPLLSHERRTLTSKDFRSLVMLWSEQIARSAREIPRGPVLASEQGPVELYGLVFALWQAGIPAVFPAEEGREAVPGYCAGAVRVSGSNIIFEKNPGFTGITLPGNADTVVYSSGTTAKPKGILHDRDDFFENARATAGMIGLDGGASVTMLRPRTVSGFSHFLMHTLTGSSLRFIDYGDTAALAEVYREVPTLSLVGSPLHLLSALQVLPDSSRPAFLFSSGDFLHPGPVSRLIERFPGSVLYKVYGLSELAGRFFVYRIDAGTDPADYPLLGRPLPGTSFSVREGELLADSEWMFSGYITESGIEPSRRPHPTGDMVTGEGKSLALAGRAGSLVKIGGSFVSLNMIEEKISRVLSPAPFVLVTRTHETLGSILCLCLESGAAPDRAVLVRGLRKVLDRSEMPHEYYCVPEIPRTDAMKADRSRTAFMISRIDPLV